jgi:hypothetical protein
MPIRHGDSSHKKRAPEYEAWVQMKSRCSNPKHPDYHNYGGRGIKVCEKWKGSYEAFLRDIGRRPSPMHSLDRARNSQGYKPGNVRWATTAQQNQNTRLTRDLTINGVTKCVSEWARTMGIARITLQSRLRKGWPLKKAIFEPVGPRVRLLTLGKITRTLSEWSVATGISETLIHYRLDAGWSLKRALTEPSRLLGRK